MFPGEYSLGIFLGNIPWEIYPREYYRGIFPREYLKFPGEYSLGIFPGEYSLGDIPKVHAIRMTPMAVSRTPGVSHILEK